MEVVRADRGVGLGPQLLDQHITMNPMARPKRQELDDRLCLPQPPRWWCGALDAHREPAEESDPHGSARVAHSRMLSARRSLGKHNRSGQRVDRRLFWCLVGQATLVRFVWCTGLAGELNGRSL